MIEVIGKAGSIFIERAKDVDSVDFNVWFENFCILGTGKTELEALNDAAEHVVNIGKLVAQAIGATATAKDDSYGVNVGGVTGG